MKEKCEKCNSILELCPADLPYHEEHWSCPNCDSTYNIVEENLNKPNYMYNLEELITTFQKNSILAREENNKAINLFKENSPGEPLPEWFTREFCINKALSAMCQEILDLKKSLMTNKTKSKVDSSEDIPSDP